MSASLPRVTEILQSVGLGPDFSAVPPAALEYARERGRAVHAAIEAEVYGYLDETTLSEDVRVRLDAYRRFVKESGYQTTHTEIEVASTTWRYRGHPDSIGWLGTPRTLLDWKATEAVFLDAAAYQLAGYRVAWNEQRPCYPIDAAAVVQLKGDGTYRVHEIDFARAEPVWLAACMVYHAKPRQEAA